MLCSYIIQIQRTPLVVRTGGVNFMNNPQQASADWTQLNHRLAPTHSHRPPFVPHTNRTGDRSSKSGASSDRSTSANEVEHMLMNQQHLTRTSVPNGTSWRTSATVCPPVQRNSKYQPWIHRSSIPQYLINECQFLRRRATIFERRVGSVQVFLDELSVIYIIV